MIITENIFCSKITPPEFTAEQIARCNGKNEQKKRCRHISDKGFCCHFGVKVREGGRIIQPSRKIVQPFPINNAEFNKDRPKRNYAVAVDMAQNSGKQLV